MSVKDLKRSPLNMRHISKNQIDPRMWYYEDGFGFYVVSESGQQARISWRQIRNALARLDKEQGR